MNRRSTYSILRLLSWPVSYYFAVAFFKSVTKGVRIPRLNPKYGYKDKEPMGGYVAYHYLNSLFNYGVTDVINKPFSKLRYEINYDQFALHNCGESSFHEARMTWRV